MSNSNRRIPYDHDANQGQVPSSGKGQIDIPHDDGELNPAHVTQWRPDNTRVS